MSPRAIPRKRRSASLQPSADPAAQTRLNVPVTPSERAKRPGRGGHWPALLVSHRAEAGGPGAPSASRRKWRPNGRGHSPRTSDPSGGLKKSVKKAELVLPGCVNLESPRRLRNSPRTEIKNETVSLPHSSSHHDHCLRPRTSGRHEINTGKQPEAGLVQGDDIPADEDEDIPAKQAFYGTTSGGGTTGHGTVFQVTDPGELTTLINFTGIGTGEPDDKRGDSPVGALILGSDGAYYGTTFSGGANNLGTVFKIVVTTGDEGSSAEMTTIADFTRSTGNARGAYPTAGLVEDSAVPLTFYGTTTYGGTESAGTIFKITDNAITTVADFDGTLAGDPESSLIKARDGIFYATTAQGGDAGTVYSFNGTTITVLHSFDITDGAAPYAELVQGLGADTALYGTTSAGGDKGPELSSASRLVDSSLISTHLTQPNRQLRKEAPLSLVYLLEPILAPLPFMERHLRVGTTITERFFKSS